MPARTQQQIMQAWKAKEPCLVSVICTTYNHELYIREAIDSFLMQETNFPFEIIIHDDASTDNTANIVREYEAQYPSIIKTICQSKNRYSKGGFKPPLYTAGHAHGKYIALCEGDDYWIDKRKLQLQIAAMREHPDVDFSFHSAYNLRKGVRDKNPVCDYGYDQILYPDAILSCLTYFAPTASYVVRREIIDNLPDWVIDVAPYGDFFIEMYGARRGGALYINKPMAVYRTEVPNSWSFTMRDRRSIAFLKKSEKMLASLQLLRNDFLEYSEHLKKKKARYLHDIAVFHLQAGNDVIYKKYIEDSVMQYRFLSKEQGMYYKFRSVPYLLRGRLKIYRLARKSKSLMKSIFMSRRKRQLAVLS